MLTINLEWDRNALTAPQSFRDGVQAAANILESVIFDTITVNVSVGYGEYDNTTPLTSNYSLGGIATTLLVSYPALKALLAARETSATNAQEINVLPNTASLNGQSTFEISTALAKAFGAVSATNAAIDGYIGFPTSFTGSGLTDTAVTELLHAMGLLQDGGDLGLFSYTSPGNHFLPNGATSTTPAYFSTDGGNTNLANYNVGFDDTLFENLSSDPLNAPTSTDVLTSLDLTEISAIGYDVASSPSLPSVSITPGTTAPGTTVAISVQNVTVPEGVLVSSLSFITAVSVPSGDAIGYYGFEDAGGDGGYFSLNGIAEPDGKFVYVLATQLSELQYVGGSSQGSESISVTVSDATTGTRATGHATATTTLVPSGSGVPIYRFYDSSTEGHFFTSSSTEVTQIVANLSSGLTFEGPAFYSVNTATDSHAVPVYRFYQADNDSHFYTDSAAEVARLQATRPDMTLEGSAFYVDPTMQTGDTAVYRYYESRSDTHLYTTSLSEVASIAATRPDVTLDGVAFYVRA